MRALSDRASGMRQPREYEWIINNFRVFGIHYPHGAHISFKPDADASAGEELRKNELQRNWTLDSENPAPNIARDLAARRRNE